MEIDKYPLEDINELVLGYAKKEGFDVSDVVSKQLRNPHPRYPAADKFGYTVGSLSLLKEGKAVYQLKQISVSESEYGYSGYVVHQWNVFHKNRKVFNAELTQAWIFHTSSDEISSYASPEKVAEYDSGDSLANYLIENMRKNKNKTC